VRPLLRRGNTLYFYPMPYEGGVCDRNTFITGTTPGQLLATLVPYLISRFGKKIYVLGADYNFGHLSAKWTTKIARENGGEVIATEFFPLNVNSFGATITKIQAAKPDVVVNTFVGPAHASFYGQWAAAGMKKQIALASQTYGEVGEHISMPQEVSEGIVVSYCYVDELDTPANKAFLDRYRAKHSEKFYISDLGMGSWISWKMWEAAVRKAGTIDRMKVIEALESGIEIDTPSGKVAMDARTHHCVLNMYICEVKGRKFEILKDARKGAAFGHTGCLRSRSQSGHQHTVRAQALIEASPFSGSSCCQRGGCSRPQNERHGEAGSTRFAEHANPLNRQTIFRSVCA
jgi:branched-chain amino acid transport system substrate-binding protein